MADVNECMTVSDLNDLVKNILKVNFDESFYVIGEISNFRVSKTNAFFTLKDENATISGVMWNYINKKDNIQIIDGKKVKVYGNITVFPKSGTYNLVVYKFELLGVGNLCQDYEKIKEYYSKLGYFSEDRKKKLPVNLNKIGVITAFDGAALQDFLYVVKKNNFLGEIYIKNCVVQGKDCPLNVVNCLRELDKMKLDVIIVTRGGGGFEDLYGFSDKRVIEELYKCNTCTISAIGHEIDFMLSDFVADIRAPTPSIAAELISCKKIYDVDEINEILNKLQNMINNKLTLLEYEIASVNKTKSPENLIRQELYNLESIKMNLLNNIKMKLNYFDMCLNNVTSVVNKANDPNVLLSKGFCMVYGFDGNCVTNINEFNDITKKKKKLKLKFIDGEASFDIRNIKLITNEQ